MNDLQVFEQQNKEKLRHFLGEYNPGHDDTQIRHFIVEKNGITDYGKYKQAVAEVFTNYQALQKAFISQKKLGADIESLQAEIEEKQMEQANLAKAIQRNLNELSKMFQLACEYEEKIASQDRTVLEKEFWEQKLARQFELSTKWQGGNLSGVVETIDALPEAMKAEVKKLTDQQLLLNG